MCLLKATSEILRVLFTLLRRFSHLFLDNHTEKYIMLHGGDYLQDIIDNNGTRRACAKRIRRENYKILSAISGSQ